jgi:2-methylcitrate dehydratase PrpD
MLSAALINGAAGHALDFDDTHTVMGGHPTAPLLPAVLALAEELGTSGADVLTAYVVGQEVQGRIGAVLGPEHYGKGWHQTSTVGVLGAAAACSWLLGLDAPSFGNALGIAASSASGLKANFGTMTKPLHAGQAAERGLLAAKLAARGFTANSDAIGAKQGFAEAAGNGSLNMDRYERYTARWLIADTLFKYHAACYLTHAGIEATQRCLDASLPNRSEGSPARNVKSVALTVNPSILNVCNIEHPTTGLEAKFSLRATQAFVVHGIDTSNVASFDDVRINRGEVQDFLASVTVSTDSSLPTTATKSQVETSAGVFEAMYDTGVPAADLVAQRAKLRSKFLGLAVPVVGADAARLAEALLSFSSARNVGEVLV